MSPAIRLLVRGLYSPNHEFFARNLFDPAKKSAAIRAISSAKGLGWKAKRAPTGTPSGPGRKAKVFDPGHDIVLSRSFSAIPGSFSAIRSSRPNPKPDPDEP
jgi:hypothetical protein